MQSKDESDVDDIVEEPFRVPTLGSLVLKMRQILERIHKDSMSGGMVLMQHTNAILERVYTDVNSFKESNATKSFHPSIIFESQMDIISKFIKQ